MAYRSSDIYREARGEKYKNETTHDEEDGA